MKKTTISVIALTLCVLMTALFFASCGGSDNASSNAAKSAVIGSWESELVPGTVYTFNEDGTGELDASGAVVKFTYTDQDAAINITYDGSKTVQVYEYTVKDDVITLKDSETGTSIDYKKK